MKVIKLNRRFSMYKSHGHQAALRFNSWTEQARSAEAALRQLTQTGGWSKDSEWYSYYGKANDRFQSRPYFITVRDPALLSAVLICLPAVH